MKWTGFEWIAASPGSAGSGQARNGVRRFVNAPRRAADAGLMGALAVPGRSPTMRTALVALIVLVRFGPNLVYAASASLSRPDPSHHTHALKWVVSPPALVVIRPPAP